MNAWYSRVDKPARPDYVVFDLDPPDDAFANAITLASVDSVRPRPGAPVSTPPPLGGADRGVGPRDFGIAELLARVEPLGDLYEPTLRRGQSLGPALRSLSIRHTSPSGQ